MKIFGFLSAAPFPTIRTSILRASYRSVLHHLPQTTFAHACTQHNRRQSSIAEAMLGRATNNYKPESQAGRAGVGKHFAPSSTSSPTLEELFKNKRQASQSIGGFTNHTNSAKTSVFAGSYLSGHNYPTPSGFSKRPNPGPTPRHGLAAALHNPNSFKDTPSIIDLTDTESHPAMATLVGQGDLSFDPDDFENDSEIDLDVEYPTALPSNAAARDPLQLLSPNQPPQSSNELPQQKLKPLKELTSSAVTWSSSPAANKATPPGARQKRKSDVFEDRSVALLSSEASIDAVPHPPKQRNLPWSHRRTEEYAEEEKDDEVAVPYPDPKTADVMCYKCKANGHFVKDCPTARRRGQPTEKTTQKTMPREDSLPWNTTTSALKEQRKLIKTRQKISKGAPSHAETQAAVHDHARSKGKIDATAPIILSGEQQDVLDLVVNQKQSVFFTGSAGTGKSVLMRSIIASLRKKYARESDRLAVTASTGLAACNIGGVTLHSFGGIGLGKEDVPSLVKKIKRNVKAKNRWTRTQILIIDEISMVDGDLFDKLEGIARALRNNGRPFGGIQLVITGDFFQLPPVPERDTRGSKFAFDAGTWSTAIHHTIGLTEVFRQKDPVFANMLNEMRLGRISDETVQTFRRLSRPIGHEDALEATELFPTRNEVDSANAMKMRSLQGKVFTYNAQDGGVIADMAMRDKLLSYMMAPPVIQLKKGAQVMLIKNLDDSLVNGSLGKVIAFMSEKTFAIYDQDPEMLEDDDAGGGAGHNESVRQARQKLKAMINKDVIGDTATQYPLVRFQIADGTSRDLLVQPEEWNVEQPNGEVQASRRQLPLILAWALSIHKAQGQTLERVKVDLGRVFEKGQAYVALSRATTQEGLQVLRFDKNKVMAHPRVAEFYNGLYSVNKALKHPKVQPKEEMKELSVSEEQRALEKMFEEETARQFDQDEEEAMAAYG